VEDCNDNNECTDDACVGGICQHTPNTLPCDDGDDLCTTNDACSNGTCTGTPKCPSGTTCDPDTGDCLAAPQTVTFQQGTAGYAGEVDTYISQGNPDTAYATTTPLMIDGSPVYQGLLRFEQVFVSEGGPIPDGATITSASLTINVTNISVDGAELFRMLVPWSDTATWNSMTSGIQRTGGGRERVRREDDVQHAGDVDVRCDAEPRGVVCRGDEPRWAWLPPAAGTDSWQFDSAEGATISNRPKLSVTFTAAAPQVTNVAPLDGATDVEANPTLSVTVTDPDSQPLDVTFYGREVGGTTPDDFTIVFITDTQYYAESNPTNFQTMMQWVNANQATHNIVDMAFTGDITSVGSVESQW